MAKRERRKFVIRNKVQLGYRDAESGRWGEYDNSFKEPRIERRVMELEFLINLIEAGSSVQKLYASLLAANLINLYNRADQGVYPRVLREAGVEFKLNLRPLTKQQLTLKDVLESLPTMSLEERQQVREHIINYHRQGGK